MAVLNRVQLLGHVGHSPKTFTTAKGVLVAAVTLATNETFQKEGVWEARTEWHNLVFFGKLATMASERLQKGSPVYVEGKLRTGQWTDGDAAGIFFFA